MARQRPDAASPGLCKQRVIGQVVVGQERSERARPAAEAQSVDRQHRYVGGDVVAVLAGSLVLPVQGLAHDDPERVAGWRRVAGRQHELVAEGMLRPAVVVAESAPLGSC